MTIQTNTLRPGLLVSLKTSLTGNVRYDKRDIERPHLTNDGQERAMWETERVIADPEEFERAQKIRQKAGSLIRAQCAASAFGLLCPESQADDLENAVRAARELVDDFNGQAALTRLRVYILVGRIAPDDVEAVRAISSEVRDLLRDMEEGIARCDVKVIRDAANKAKGLGAMLNPVAAARIQVAIDAARSSARRIVKAGEEAAQEIDRAAIRRISEQRTAFLDIGDDGREVAAPVSTGRAIDLDPVGARPVDYCADCGAPLPCECPYVTREEIQEENQPEILVKMPAPPQFSFEL